MSSNKIIEKAIYSFATNGYAGTSISNIAELVGIKKSTIYSHYKSKDEIFEKSMETSFQVEIDFLEAYFSKKYNSPLDALEIFLEAIKERYVDDTIFTLNFVYKMGYMLVEKYNDVIKKHCDDYYIAMENLIIKYLINEGINEDKAKNQARVYTTLLDGLMISLIYSGEARYKERRDHIWKFFSKSFIVD